MFYEEGWTAELSQGEVLTESAMTGLPASPWQTLLQMLRDDPSNEISKLVLSYAGRVVIAAPTADGYVQATRQTKMVISGAERAARA